MALSTQMVHMDFLRSLSLMSVDTLDAAFTTVVAKALEEVCLSKVGHDDVLNAGFREMRYLIGFAPRLYSFTHRPILSLRHPYLAFTVRGHHTDGIGAADRQAAVNTTLDPSGAGSILLGEATKWASIGRLYDEILQFTEASTVVVSTRDGELSSPLLLACRSRIENHPSVIFAVGKFWRMLTGGGTKMKPCPASSADVDRWFAGETISAASYVYLHVRLGDILYGEPAAAFDLVDFVVGDLAIDSAAHVSADLADSCEVEPSKGTGEDAFGHSTFCSSDDASVVDTGSDGSHSGSVSSSCASSNSEGGVEGTPITGEGLQGMPRLRFGELKRSLLELVDNWTTTVHPHEYAAVLLQWFDRAFGVEEGPGRQPQRGPSKDAALSKPGVVGGRLGQFNSGVTPGALSKFQKVTNSGMGLGRGGNSEVRRAAGGATALQADRRVGEQQLAELNHQVSAELHRTEMDGMEDDALATSPLRPIKPASSPFPPEAPPSARRRARAQRNLEYHLQHYVPSVEGSRTPSGRSTPALSGGGGHKISTAPDTPSDALGAGVSSAVVPSSPPSSAVLGLVEDVRAPLFYSVVGPRYSEGRFSPQRGAQRPGYEMRSLATRLFEAASL